MAVIEQIHQQVNGAGAETGLRKQLLELRLRFELDEIDEAEYNKAALAITRRLQALQGADDGGADDADST